ncbi:MAG: glycosyltransferase [Gammaproteobacteria bacterium]|jgi:UDP:flavonoid glycosyltransferase YjiC (YdhE family)
MRIGLQTWGSNGDIRPFMALAKGLQSAGHEVTLWVTSVDGIRYDESAARLGIHLQHVATPVIEGQDELLRATTQIGNESNPIRQAKFIIDRFLVPAEAPMYETARQLCRDNDLVVGHFFHYPLQTAAEITGAPYVSIMLQHNMIPTRYLPPAGMPALGPIANRLFWWLLRKVLNNGIKPFADNFRRQHGLPVAGDLLRDIWTSHQLNLIAVSHQLCQPLPDWPLYHKVCGFLNLQPETTSAPFEPQLERFIDQGERPVFIGFGSMLVNDVDTQRKTLSLLVEAVKLAGCRAVIQASLWDQCGVDSDETIYYVSHCDHHRLFPRCELIVHHGGAGTVQTTLLAGVPSVVVAHIAEQQFWGVELKRLGVAAGVLTRRKLTAKKLARYIQKAIASVQLRQRVQEIARRMRTEEGVSCAVELINRQFER